MDRLGSRRIRFKLRLRFGRRHCRTGFPGSFTGGAVIGHRGRVDLRLVPGAVINDQHTKNAENSDYDRYDQRRAATSPRVPFIRMMRFHFCIRLDCLAGIKS